MRENASASEMDSAEAELASARARLEAAQAALEQAQEQLGYTEIRAPYSGIVIARQVEPGEIASPGQPLMTGLSLARLRVAVDVPQSLIPAVRELAEVTVYLRHPGPDRDVVRPEHITLFPFADPRSNRVRVRLDLAEAVQGLFPGMLVKTGFVTGTTETLRVPEAAVVYRSEVTGVYVVDADGGVRLRQIRAGRNLGDELVVLSGLTEGQAVALDPVAAGVALKARARLRAKAAAEGGAGQDD